MPFDDDLFDECESPAPALSKQDVVAYVDMLPTRGNLFVPTSASRFPDMVRKAETADPRDWQYGMSLTKHEAGIWVPYSWW